jgi:hypothetical protein
MKQPEEIIYIIDKMIHRAEKKLWNANKRKDWSEYSYLSGQIKVLEELKSQIN